MSLGRIAEDFPELTDSAVYMVNDLAGRMNKVYFGDEDDAPSGEMITELLAAREYRLMTRNEAHTSVCHPWASRAFVCFGCLFCRTERDYRTELPCPAALAFGCLFART